MRRVSALSALGVVVAVSCLAATRPLPVVTAQSNGTLIKVDPASQTVPLAGGNFTVDIRVEDVTNLGAFQFDIVFDPAVIQVRSFTEGPFLKSSGRSTFCSFRDIASDTRRYACASGGSQAGPNGSGVLATATFSPLAEAASGLDLQQGALYDPGADLIAATWQSGSVSVGQSPSPTVSPALPLTPSNGREATSTPAVQATFMSTMSATPVSGATPNAVSWTLPGSGSTGASDNGSNSGASGGVQWSLWGPIIAVASVLGVGLVVVGLRLIARRRTG